MTSHRAPSNGKNLRNFSINSMTEDDVMDNRTEMVGITDRPLLIEPEMRTPIFEKSNYDPNSNSNELESKYQKVL